VESLSSSVLTSNGKNLFPPGILQGQEKRETSFDDISGSDLREKPGGIPLQEFGYRKNQSMLTAGTNRSYPRQGRAP
jgi:hypothetical protein